MAQAGQCDLLYLDKSGFSPNPPLKYGWAPIGHIRCTEVVHGYQVKFSGRLPKIGGGKRLLRGVQAAIDRQLPFVCFIASGDARMQKGLLFLLQIAKTTARLAQHRLPFISVLTDPTSGGASASFCSLGDVVIAEPKALIAFTGARVIKNTLGVTLPDGYQRPEFVLEHGAIDMVVDRRQMPPERAARLALLLKLPKDAVA